MERIRKREKRKEKRLSKREQKIIHECWLQANRDFALWMNTLNPAWMITTENLAPEVGKIPRV